MDTKTSILLDEAKNDLIKRLTRNEITYDEALSIFTRYLEYKVANKDIAKIELHRQYNSLRKRIIDLELSGEWKPYQKSQK